MFIFTPREETRIEIQPDEAAVVRWIFQSYVAGIGTAEIARELRESNVPSYYGGVWSPMRIVEMLKNERYAGNALNQKEFTSDHLTKARVRNRGELPMNASGMTGVAEKAGHWK